jgi:hypothetical protein
MVIQGGMKRLHLALQKRCILLQPLRTLCNLFIFVTIGEILNTTSYNNLIRTNKKRPDGSRRFRRSPKTITEIYTI